MEINKETQKQQIKRVVRGYKTRSTEFGDKRVLIGEFEYDPQDEMQAKTAVLSLCKVGEMLEKFNTGFGADDGATELAFFEESPNLSNLFHLDSIWITYDEALRAFNDWAVNRAIDLFVNNANGEE